MPTLTLDDPLHTAEEAAALLRGNERTLERWRHEGGGPPFVKIGRRVLYKHSDLLAWVAQQRRAHTSATVPPAA